MWLGDISARTNLPARNGSSFDTPAAQPQRLDHSSVSSSTSILLVMLNVTQA
jgi:hypothetical protein